MKNGKHSLLFILLGVLLCLMPIEAKAAEYDYEVGFKFFEYDKNVSHIANDSDNWMMVYKNPSFSSMFGFTTNEITDLTTLKAGDYFVISTTLKTIGDPSAVSFALYYSFDPELLEITSLKKQIDDRNVTNGGVFPNSDWKQQGIENFEEGGLKIGIDCNSSNYMEYNNTDTTPIIFIVFKAKKDITTENPVVLKFYTQERPSTSGGNIQYTGASTRDSLPVGVKTIDYEPETPKSGVKTLSGLKLFDTNNTYLDLTTETDLNTTTFNGVVPANINSVDITITPKHAGATVVQGEVTSPIAAFSARALDVGINPLSDNTLTETLTLTGRENNFKYTVTAENGDTEVYNVNILKISDDATLSSLSITDHNLNETFAPGTLNYTAGVPYKTDTINVNATATDTNATVTGTGSKTLSVGSQNVTVTVEPEGCKTEYQSVPGNTSYVGGVCTGKKDYVIAVTRAAASTNADLKTLTVSPGTLTNTNESHTGFDKSDLNYTVLVDNNVSSITLNAEADDTNATFAITKGSDTITNNTASSLDVGDNVFKITVTPESSTPTKTYTVTVTRKSDNKDLSGITVTNGSKIYTLDPTFNAGTLDYSTVVAPDIDNVDISVTTADSTATPVGAGNLSLGAKGSETSKSIIVTSQNGTTKTYNVTVKRLNDEAKLGSLSLSNITLDPAFNENTLTYTMNNVPYQTKDTTVTATTKDANMEVVSGTGSWTFASSGATPNTKKVRVNAENCKTEYASVPGNTCAYTEYELNVNRLAPATNTYLSGITVSAGTLKNDTTGNNNDFNKENKNYTVEVSNATDKITITGTPEDPNATVTNLTDEPLTVGSKTFKLKVTAEDGTTTTDYNITVIRKSNDASLSNLRITSTPQGTMDPSSVNSTTKTYKYTYNESVPSITITATTTHANALVKIASETPATHTATATFDPKTTSSVTITVTAEDGNDETYTVNFERETSNDASLKSLTVKNGTNTYPINEAISPSRTKYTVTVPNDIDNVTVEAEATSDAATVNPTSGNVTVGFDSPATHTITVTPESGSAVTYTVEITREKSNDADLSDLLIDGTSITGFASGTLSYNIGDVNSSTSSLAITYTKKNEYANVDIIDNNLNEGANTVKVKVTAQDGVTTKEYLINVNKTSNIAELDSFTITNSTGSGGKLSPSFNAGTKEYTYYYPKGTTSVTTTSTASHNGTVNNNGNDTFNVPATTSISITVTSEESNTETYVINLEEEKDNDSSLKSLSVKDDENNEYITSFNAGTVTYNIPNFPDNKNKVTVTYEANSAYVKDVTINGTSSTSSEITLHSGDNEIKVKVTAEDDTTTEYTINIHKNISQNATLTALEIINKDNNDPIALSPSFSPNTLTYNMTVNYAVENITINGTETAGATIIDGTGDQSLTVGDNQFLINIEAEDGTPGRYTINIHRKSNDTSLDSTNAITVSNGTITKVPDSEEYNLEISDKFTTVTITPNLNHNLANIENASSLTNINLNTLTDNKITFKVKAEDDTYEKNYTINVVKLSSDTSLASLTYRNKIDNVLNPEESITVVPGRETYALTVPYGTEEVSINATLNDSKASITEAMPVKATINNSTGSASFTVTAEDSSTTTYTINVTVDPDTNATIKTLKIFNHEATWNAIDKVYEVTVDSTEYNMLPANISVERDDTRATANVGAGMELLPNLNNDINDYSVSVTAADRTTTVTYPIKITRPASTDNSLEKLESDIGTVTEKEDDTYVITLPFGTESFNATATTNFIKATKMGDGAKTVSGLTNKEFTITVTSESGDNKTYTVKVETLGLTNNPEDGSAGLSVENHTLTPEFAPTTKDYSIGDVPANENNLTVHAHADGDITITYELDNEGASTNNVIDVSSKSGTGTIKVTITSNLSGEKVTYNIAFNKLEKVGLTSLQVENHPFNETFDIDTLSYNIKDAVKEDVASLTVNATHTGSATVTYGLNTSTPTANNVIDISGVSGNNSIKVVVTPANGSAPITYTINFTKESPVSDEKITSSIHNVDDDYVWNNRATIDIDDYLNEFDNNRADLHLYEDDGTTPYTEGYAGTGLIIKLEKDNKVLDQKSVALIGDTNGDGRITTNDAVLASNHFMKLVELTGAYEKVADTNEDGRITTNDAVLISNHFMKLVDLFE